MTPLFKKLNFKDHKSILVINSPESFENELQEMQSIAAIHKEFIKVKEIEFAMCFATKQSQIDQSIKEIYPRLKGDVVLWMCYPKGTSKKYKCDFNRDTGWQVLGQYNLVPVRAVAIDEDWSALRFRKIEFVKSITRRESFALTDEAKKRTSQKGK
jgi:hypothetical protein